MPANPAPLALIIGASRGLGRALAEEYLARNWTVIATVRSERTQLHERPSPHLEIAHLDITDTAQIHALRARLEGRRIDLLFVNAGIANDRTQTIAEVSTEDFIRIMVTNALAPMRVIEAFQDLVPPTGQIAAMSSGLGSVANNTSGGWEAYRASKAALNTLMRSFAARDPDNRSLALIAPGWVRTDMGGAQATLSIAESIPRVVDTLIANAGQPGLRYLDRFGDTVPW